MKGGATSRSVIAKPGSAATATAPSLLLNLGCGTSYHPDWFNLDFHPASPEVHQADLRDGIPLPDGSCAVVYHSHILEHFSRDNAIMFLKECHRVLEPGGLIRIAIPDLERIARGYIAALEQALAGESDSSYRWFVIELLDQMTRQQSGGQMFQAISSAENLERDLIRERLGSQAEIVWSALLHDGGRRSFRDRLHGLTCKTALRWVGVRAVRILVRIFFGRRLAKAWDEAAFRETGEVHRWMYDRYSLAQLLKQCGLKEPRQTSAFESAIPEFASYQLDVAEGKVRKPDSLFMEALRPSSVE